MDEYIGMVKLFAGDYAPQNWAICNGQLLNVNDHMDLFTLLGTTYGGDGGHQFGLPDLRNRVPIGAGEKDGMFVHLGEKLGAANPALKINEMPVHNHEEFVNSQDSTLTAAEAGSTMAVPIGNDGNRTLGYKNENAALGLHVNTLGMTGDGAGHNNMQPSIGLNYIICITGPFPSRP
ncbi:MAG: phage tail protein [Crocinitomicaceae bacterium]|jgi:microcystin-dependent protein|nr:phage tail protein [Crocinitomicaceae bacterium]